MSQSNTSQAFSFSRIMEGSGNFIVFLSIATLCACWAYCAGYFLAYKLNFWNFLTTPDYLKIGLPYTVLVGCIRFLATVMLDANESDNSQDKITKKKLNKIFSIADIANITLTVALIIFLVLVGYSDMALLVGFVPLILQLELSLNGQVLKSGISLQNAAKVGAAMSSCINCFVIGFAIAMISSNHPAPDKYEIITKSKTIKSGHILSIEKGFLSFKLKEVTFLPYEEVIKIKNIK